VILLAIVVTVSLRIAIADRFRWLIRPIGLSLAASLPPSIELDDLIQVGELGLWQATRNFSPARAATFGFYAKLRIRGAMLDSLKGRSYREARATQSLSDPTSPPSVVGSRGNRRTIEHTLGDRQPSIEQRMIADDELRAELAVRQGKLARIDAAIRDPDAKFKPISQRQKNVLALRRRGMTQIAAAAVLGIRQQSLQETETLAIKKLRFKLAA
jgi:RNA polymerase sigma factor (sigma-70 family)